MFFSGGGLNQDTVVMAELSLNEKYLRYLYMCITELSVETFSCVHIAYSFMNHNFMFFMLVYATYNVYLLHTRRKHICTYETKMIMKAFAHTKEKLYYCVVNYIYLYYGS